MIYPSRIIPRTRICFWNRNPTHVAQKAMIFMGVLVYQCTETLSHFYEQIHAANSQYLGSAVLSSFNFNAKVIHYEHVCLSS
jgi:hypothetical protein